ncbi:MAG: TPM domain-containing protein [Erysipelotrichaceae bacterium]|nr:TPM domain-containing protein [Erysipelotrichaceae bacterium]MBR2533755.1 TPM domain-containing protein [Erysipelotrichaceae bacterium]
MKKILCILFAMLLLGIGQQVNAEDGHIIMKDGGTDYSSYETYQELNEDLERIENEYDIAIYFIYDDSIENSENGVSSYAKDFLNRHQGAKNTVVMVVAKNYYTVKTDGPQGNLVSNEARKLFELYNNASSRYDGIEAFYQYVVKIINEESYVSGAPRVSGKPRVYDGAGLLGSDEVSSLTRKLKDLSDRHDMDILVLTSDSLNGMDTDNYADDFYDYNGYKDDGVLLFISMSTSEMYISTKGRGTDYITDYGIDYIFGQISDDLSSDRFYDAFVKYADLTDGLIREAESGNVVDVDSKPKKSFTAANVGISAIAGLISSLITALVLKGQMRNVHYERYAGNYVVSNSFHITGMSDMLVNRHVSRTPRSRNNTSSGHNPTHYSGGGSHTHTSSSGSSHGGHGAHF